MDFGMSAAVSRFVSKYRAEGNQEAVNNFLGVIYKLYIALDGVILTGIGWTKNINIDIYKNKKASKNEAFSYTFF